jgi:hypothetical protein
MKKTDQNYIDIPKIIFQKITCAKKMRLRASVVDPNSFFSDSDPQIVFFGFGYEFGFLD